MTIVLTNGADAREYMDRIERLGGEVTPEVVEAVAQKEAARVAREERAQ